MCKMLVVSCIEVKRGMCKWWVMGDLGNYKCEKKEKKRSERFKGSEYGYWVLAMANVVRGAIRRLFR